MASNRFRIGLSRSEKFSIGFVLLWLVVILLAIAGWIINLFKIAGALDGGFTTMLVARLLGAIVAPLGAVLGWF